MGNGTLVRFKIDLTECVLRNEECSASQLKTIEKLKSDKMPVKFYIFVKEMYLDFEDYE